MLIDEILDRKERIEYTGSDEYIAYDLYTYLMEFGETYEDVTLAMDYCSERDVKKALKAYIDAGYYGNEEIKDFIDSVDWLEDSHR